MKCKALSIVAAIAATVATALVPFANVNAWTADFPGATSYSFRREINGVTDNVTNTFTYTITAKDSNPATVSGAPTTTTIEFDSVAPTGGKATARGVIDFTNAEFTTLGEYGFTIKEAASSNASAYPLSNETFTVWVSVRNVTDSGGVPTGEHTATLTGATDSSGNKIQVDASEEKIVFADGKERTYIEVHTFARGNSADPNECFKVSVHFDNDAANSYRVTTNTTCANAYALLAADEASISGTNIITLYLRDSDTAIIGKDTDGTYQIPLGLRYVIIQEGAGDYKTYIDSSETDKKTSEVKTTVSADDPEYVKQNVSTIVNIKEITPKTGLDRSLLPYAIIAMIGVTGAILIARNKRSA